MNLEKITQKTREALTVAERVAQSGKNPEVYPEHILQGVLADSEGLPAVLLEKLSVDSNKVTKTIEEYLNKQPTMENESGQSHFPGFNRESLSLLQKGQDVAAKMKDEFLSLEHLFLSYLKNNFQLSTTLKNMGLDSIIIEPLIQKIRNGSSVVDDQPESKYEVLKKYGQNLNELAKAGKLDPVIGRDEEIKRCIQILSRRTKNNPMLVGEPGVGKTAIVEGLANRIIQDDVPDIMKNKILITLDLGSLIAGAKYRGEFEDRLKAVLKEVISSEGNIILFIDEIHTLIGAGATEGAMDAANLLKPALARGDLRLIGATTLNEFQKRIEKDAALERRFQQVYVNEPTVDDTITILRGLRDKYELHHGIRITDQAIVTAATLSHRYISDRFLPDKAVDLIDEACSKLRIELGSMPAAMEEIDRKIRKLTIEETALHRESDKASKERMVELKKELSNLKEEFNSYNFRLSHEKSAIAEITKLKKEIEQKKQEESEQERLGNLEQVAKIRYAQLPEMLKKLESLQASQSSNPDDNQSKQGVDQKIKLLNEVVREEDIANIVSRWTNIPVVKLIQTEKDKLVAMEDILHKRIVGQKRAINVLSNTIRRSRAGLSEENRPVGTFMFLGPTGVGKTETAKALSHFLFDDEKSMIRFDMSEYMERYSVSRLIGSPPGYVGYDEGGQLSEAVRRHPYSVLLFDEIEKAHPEVFNIFLQILDDGIVTDSKGRKVNFKNTLVIFTTNLHSDDLPKSFKPEFLNRIDSIVPFHVITEEHLAEIFDIELQKIVNRVEKKGIHLSVSSALKKHICEKSYDPAYGARPLKRKLQEILVNPLALKILEDEATTEVDIKADIKNDKVVFTTQASDAHKQISA